MNIRLLACLALLAMFASQTIGDSTWDFITSRLGIYLRRKYVTFFKFADYNRDGNLQEADFHSAVDKMASLYPQVDPGRIEYYHKVIVPKAWKAFRRMFPKAEPAPVTVLDMLLIIANTPNLLLNVRAFTDGVFNVSDLNGDGLLNVPEYTVLFNARDKPAKDGEVSYHESDLNGDGNVTPDEFMVCSSGFFLISLQEIDRCKDLVGDLVSVDEADGGLY